MDAIRALDRGAGAIVEVNATAVDPKADRKLVHLTGTMRPGTPARDPAFSVTGDGYYPGQDQAQPAVGDTRVSFTGLASQTVSVAAASAGGMLTAFRDTNGYTIALAAPGAVTAAALFNDEMKAESTLTWILRGVGFVLVLIGFLCMTRPLTMPFAILPFLESIVGAGAFLAAITLSVPVTLVTIAIAWIVHRPLIGILLLVAAAGGVHARSGLRRTPAGGSAASRVCADWPRMGCTQLGATSTKGASTNPRRCARGCGTMGSGSARTRSPMATISRSKVRGAFGSPRTRPNAVSMACRAASNAAGSVTLPTRRATPLI